MAFVLAASAPGYAQFKLPEKSGEPYRLARVIAPKATLPNASKLPQRTLKSNVKATAVSSLFAGRTFYGNLTNSDDWAGSNLGGVPYGVYSYTFGDEANFKAVATATIYNFMSSAFGRDRLLGVYPMSIMGALNGVRYMELDSAKFDKRWEETYPQATYGYIPTAMTYDPTSDKFYAALYNDQLNGLNWAVFNDKTRRFEVLKKWSNDFQPLTLGATPDGKLYSIGLDGYYYAIDKTTGEAEMIGEPGVTPANYVQSMGYDGRTGTFIWEAVTGTGEALYSVDVNTGEATLINSLNKNEQLSSLFFKSQEAKDKAPAAIGDLSLSFTGTASQSGDLCFTVPTKAYDGTALSGNVNMTIYVDGTAVKQNASVAPGSKQTQPISLTNDNHYMAVVLSNSEGFSPNNYLYQYVGYDTPEPVTDVKLAVDSTAGQFKLTWTAPKAGINKGYLDMANMKYNIVRMPDSTTVAQGISGNVFTEPLRSKLERYYYRVYPVNADKTGAVAESNKVLYGNAYDVPYSEDFYSQETLPLFTIIDGSGEGVTWEYNSYNQCMGINTSAYSIKDRTNDWLVTPGVNLKPGIAYALIYNMRNTFQDYTESYKILYGTNPSDTTSFKLIAQCDSFDVSGELTDVENDFHVDKAGTYYFALVCTSKGPDCTGMFVKKISVDALGGIEAPAAPTELTLTPDSTGEMKAELSFTAPTKTLAGDTLIGNLTAKVYRDDAADPITSLQVEAGKKARYTDTTVKGVDMHKYAVAMQNAEGEGKRATASAFIGVYTPTYSNTFDDESSAKFFKSFLNGEPVDGYEVSGWQYNNWSHDLELSYYPKSEALPATMSVLFPAIKLAKDSVYEVSFTWDNSVYGTAEVPAEFGYTRSAKPVNLVKIASLPRTGYNANLLQSFNIVAPADGKYYPYINISTAVANYLSPTIDSLVIKKVASAFAPSAVTALKAVNDQTGALKATVSCTAPTTDYAGRALTGTLTVNIFRGTNNTIPVKTFTKVDPGAQLTWTDESALKGYDTYMVVPANDHGNGKACSDTCYVGVDQPLNVENYAVKGNASNTGAVITWDAPKGGVHGGVINNGSLKYIVAEYLPQEQDANKKLKLLGRTSSHSYNVDNVETADSQAVHYYTVIPYTDAGYDLHYAYIANVVLGKPYTLPYKESFANGAETTNVWLASSTSNYAKWSEQQDGKTYKSQDGDNGMALFFFGSFYENNQKGYLVSPKFKVADKAYVDFWVYQGIAKHYSKPAYLVVKQNVDDGKYVALGDTIFINDSTEGWHRHHLELKNTTGNFATLFFEASVSGSNDYVFIDNIVVDTPTTTGIGHVLGAEAGVRGVKNGISLVGLKGQLVSIYTVGGQLVDEFKASGNDIRNLAPGIYVVRAGGMSFKVTAR